MVAKVNNKPTFFHADKETCIQQALRAYVEEGRHAITVRHYYYKLLSSDSITLTTAETSKENAYNFVSRLLSEARDNGSFPFEAVVDNGRRAHSYSSFDSVSEYVWNQKRSYYRLDPWRGQRERIEIIVEKDGLLDMVARYTQHWRIPVRTVEGFSSVTRAKDLASHYGTGKHYTVLYLGDFDPSGILIQRKLKEKLNEYGSYPAFKRIALTQSDTLSLPAYSAVPVDPDSDHAKAVKWFERYGQHQQGYEVETLPPTELERKILKAISPYINSEKFEAALRLEKLIRRQATLRLRDAFNGYLEAILGGVAESSLDWGEQLAYLLTPEQHGHYVQTGNATYSVWGDGDDDED